MHFDTHVHRYVYMITGKVEGHFKIEM